MKKIVNSLFCFAVLVCLASPGIAKEKACSEKMKSEKTETQSYKHNTASYKISFKITAGGVERTASIVAMSGIQVNYTAKTTTPGEGNTSGKLNITGVVANFLPVFVSETNKFDVQAQFELSSEGLTNGGNVLIQHQTEFIAENGKTVVLVDDADKRIEVKIEDLK